MSSEKKDRERTSRAEGGKKKGCLGPGLKPAKQGYGGEENAGHITKKAPFYTNDHIEKHHSAV